MAEYELVEEEEEVLELPVEETKPKRTSNPIKQGLAGFTDIATGIPMLAGFAGAGIEGAYNTVTREGDQSLFNNFWEALESGLDNTLLNAGATGRDKVNEFLDIKEPVSTEDQIARLIGGFAPIPLVAPVAGASKLANAAKTSFNLLTPAVKTGKGFGRRAGFQLGLGTGIDQGIRTLIDKPEMPLMFSDAALEGQTGPEFVLEEDEEISIGADDGILEDTPEGIEQLRELDKKVQKEQDWEDTKFWLMTAGALIGGAASAKWAANKAIAAHGSPKDVGRYVHAQMVDKAQALRHTLKDMDVDETTIDHVVSNAHTDTVDIALNFLRTGRLGQDFISPSGRQAHSIDALSAKYTSLGNNKKSFDEAMLASIERAARYNGDESALWGNARSVGKLNNIIDGARKNGDVKQLMDDFADTFEVLLEYQVHRGIISRKTADTFRMRATGPDGRVSYMPLYHPDPTTFGEKLARNFLGVQTKQGQEASIIPEFGARSVNVGDELLSPLDAMRKYVVSTISHANEQSFRSHVLDKLAQITRQGDDVYRNIDADNNLLPTGRDVQYVGKGTNLDDINNIPIEIFKDNPKMMKMFKNGSINDLKASKNGDDLMTVHYGDELRVYYVPDKGLKAALELNPRLSGGWKALSTWKNIFTRGTTGDLSLFAPISHMFSAQQVAVNTAAREGLWSGIKSVGQSLGGTGKLIAANGAGDMAAYLSQKIAKRVANGDTNNPVMQRLQRSLERRFMDATINQVRMESGRTVTGMGNIGHGTIDEIMEVVGKPSVDFFGKDEMVLLKRLWQGWNNAWHEGPAYGAMEKHIGKVANEGGEITSQVIRDAVDISKTVAGDMRRVGASGFAQGFNASVPFASAMVQSWNSIAGAARVDFGKFIVGASALIGVPTLSEMTYNAILSEASDPWPDPKNPDKQWTYNDYYWNGFTTQQRTDNFIYFVPGKPPWEAIVVPVSPEWGLFRGVTMEAADAIFGFSNEGNIAMVDQAKTNRDMFWNSLMRVLDIPLPPPLAAAGSALGMDVRVGLSREVQPDPDDPGATTSIMRMHPIGQGERVTRRAGKSRFANSFHDRTTAAIIQDIFGAAGAAYLNVADAVAANSNPKLGGSITQGLSAGWDALGESAQRQMRYTQPLHGNALRPNANDEIAKHLFTSRQVLKNLHNQLRNGYIGAGIVYADGQLIDGDPILPPDDPINLELAASAQKIDSNIGLLDQDIARLKKDLTTLGNASASFLPRKERNDKYDSKVLQIQAIKAQQLSMLHELEEAMSEYLSERYERDIYVNFASWKPRADLPTSSISKELHLSPPTSR